MIIFFVFTTNVFSQECDETTRARMIKSGISDKTIEEQCGKIGSKKKVSELERQKEEELKRQKEEELKRQKEEELKRQKEEELKRKEEELRKKKDEERIKIENEKRIKERQINYSFTFRSIGTVNTFEYKILENVAVGILYENGSASNENETIKESSVTTAIFVLYGFNECYYCDTDAFVGVYGSGNQTSTTDQGSEHKYNVQYLNLLYGYQWYWNIDISLALAGGLIYRNKSNISHLFSYIKARWFRVFGC